MMILKNHLRPRRAAVTGAALVALAAAAILASASPAPQAATQGDAPALAGGGWVVGETLFQDDFGGELTQWTAELEKGGTVNVADGRLDVDVPGGCTLWFRPEIEGPVVIEYTATVVAEGGANDRASDLNCFWMATDPRGEDFFAIKRSGKFSDYDELRCYYVGYGGNHNTTTRFRRYIGVKGDRPLRPEHDLTDKKYLIVPNAPMHIRLVAADGRVEFWRDGERVFVYDDAEPYTKGRFAFRTVRSHLRIDDFEVRRLKRAE